MTKATTKEAAVAAEALLLDDWFDRSRTGFGLGRAALSRRCWRRNFLRRCRVRAMVGASQVRTRRRRRLSACATGIASGR